MHRGHHKVFEALDERAAAQNLKKAVTTFDPHPSVVLNPERKRTDYLTPLSDKLEMIEQHDVDYCIVINFSSRFASVTAEEFVQDYIINNRVKEVIAGFDFTYGKFGKGNMSVLNEMDEFSTTIVGKQEMETEKSLLLQLGSFERREFKKANEQLGYLYRIKGTVVQGEKRGRTIGFPTANVQPSDDYVLSKKGFMLLVWQ